MLEITNRNAPGVVYNTLLRYWDAISDKHEVVCVMLYGSQNYRLDTQDSDVDAKAIVLPTFEDFVLNKKPYSYDMDFGKDGKLDIKDIRLMFDNFKKQNINFLELLFSDYCVYNPKYKTYVNQLVNNAEKIAHYNTFSAVNCMYGMSMEKYKALEHPYPATIHKIEKFGYDPKQLHHILRLYEFATRYIDGEPFADCLISQSPEHLIKVKEGVYNLDNARIAANHYSAELRKLKEKYMEDNKPFVDKEVEVLFNNIVYSILRDFFKEQIMGE